MAGKSLNKACLIGNAGKDAELRYTNSGKAYASFSLATSESWKDQSGAQQERVTWHNVVAWDKLGEICGNYVKKGKQIYIEGRINNRSYDDKEGVKKYISEVVATDLILLGGGAGGGERASSGFSQNSTPSEQPSSSPMNAEFDQGGSIPDSDLPF